MFLRQFYIPLPQKRPLLHALLEIFKLIFAREEHRTVTYFFADYAESERKKNLAGFTVYRNKKNQCKNACIKIAKILSY